MIKLIRQAWNGAAVISDLSVLCGGWNSLAGSVCGFIGPNLGGWSVLVSSPAQIKTPAGVAGALCTGLSVRDVHE